MLRRQAYRFELRPSGQQLRNLRQFAGSCRFVYNKALALNTARYKQKEKRLAMPDCVACCRTGRRTPVPVRGSSASLAAGLKELERAYTNFFEKRSEFPKFRRKVSGEFPGPARLRGRQR